ncbi:MAG: hypothetical protein JXR76_21375 [Deltaproteobacteria bacterium]|nr:hypothetical protein [Deltaproteobacteria bacterium]
MPLREIRDTDIEQECDVCGAIHAVPEDDVTVGVETEGQLDARVIPLPPCANCGATEYLISSADNEAEHPSPGSFGHRHRLMVDALHSKLVNKGRVAAGIDTAKAKGKERTTDELNKWFKGSMKLQRLKEEKSAQPEKGTPVEAEVE